jgi:predicted RNase H-like nuclease (RuvC/YqgF family)
MTVKYTNSADCYPVISEPISITLSTDQQIANLRNEVNQLKINIENQKEQIAELKSILEKFQDYEYKYNSCNK